MDATLSPQDALIIVDVQRDFCPGGALPIPNGDAVLGPLNRWIERACAGGATIVASRDWHPHGHPSFRTEGGPWPDHCLQDSEGARFHNALALPETVLLVSKGTRFDRDQLSAFDETGLDSVLRKRGIRRVWIGGLAFDVCVRATAIDAAQEGFDTHVIVEACRAIKPDDAAKVIAELEHEGVVVEANSRRAPAPPV